ncbi:hypothetical protein ANCCEY_11518 [Ancylostoma ceylanicum]|uniref:Unspecific monooxygenase n=1 Tax=Ancylostoma ceylanicum TaxID=53326 RepID=A0A0D6LBZ7_9BILA|nr:hypothetical protein ANCCEY_11518 [Ancylostoma ceylanicum]
MLECIRYKYYFTNHETIALLEEQFTVIQNVMDKLIQAMSAQNSAEALSITHLNGRCPLLHSRESQPDLEKKLYKYRQATSPSLQVYGKVYGIQEGLRRTLVVSDVEMIKELFMRKFEYFYGRKTNAIVGDVEKDSRVHLFESQGVRWKRLRAISSPAFSSGSLKKIRPTVEDSTLALMELFDERAGQQAFNIFTYYKEFTMDVICRIAMGQKGSKMFTDDKVDRIDKEGAEKLEEATFDGGQVRRVWMKKSFGVQLVQLSQHQLCNI